MDAEEQSATLLQLPNDTYSRVATYTQNLRRTLAANSSDIASSLIGRQRDLIEGMVRRLTSIRITKAIEQGTLQRLLQEERYICSFNIGFEKRAEAFVDAVVNGKPSFLDMVHRNEMGKSIIIRFLKPVTEIVGFDLRRYGPFKAQDLGFLPSANADILVTNGEGAVVYPRESL